MARDQRNYRERDRERHNASKRRPSTIATAWDGLLHQTSGAAMPYTFCGKRVVASGDDEIALLVTELCEDCWA